jgi:uncharacterized protein (TIGR03437 family)
LALGFALLDAAGWPQSNPALRLDSLPTGLAPLGVAITTATEVGATHQSYVAIANSGDNSVGVLRLNDGGFGEFKTLTPLASITGIPGPYAVAACGPLVGNPNLVAVTSPSDNSVRVVQLPDGKILGTGRGAAQPYSAACFYDVATGGSKLAVSSFGDSSLVVFDVATFAVTATIPGVPGSRAFHGIAVALNSAARLVAWVAGSDANLVTIVDLTNAKVLAQIPVPHPTAVLAPPTSPGYVYVASAANSNVAAYSLETLQVVRTFQNVPNPQDFVNSGLGYFATIGGQDSLWRLDPVNTAGTIPGIPGAAALAATSSNAKPNVGDTVVLVTATKSNSVFLIQPQPGFPAEFGIANGASFANWAAPGLLASAFTTTGASSNFYASALPLPTSLGNLNLRIGGSLQLSGSTWTYSSTGSSPAPLLFVGPTQLNFQVPPGVAPGDSVAAQLTKPDGTTLLTTLRVTATAPGIFSVPQNGQGQGAVLNQDNSINGSPQALVGAKLGARGSVIQIFATGAGETTPALAAGEAAPASGNPLVLTKVQPTVTIGGKNAKVLFSGMAPGFVGLWQINAEIPQDVTPGPVVPLVITAGGVQSNTVTIAVQ